MRFAGREGAPGQNGHKGRHVPTMAVCCVPGTAFDTLMLMVVVAAAIAVNYGSMTGLALHMRGSVTYIRPLTTMERGFMVPFLNRNWERENNDRI